MCMSRYSGLLVRFDELYCNCLHLKYSPVNYESDTKREFKVLIYNISWELETVYTRICH